MQDKVEIDFETLNEISREIRSLRVMNMELHSQLAAVQRLLVSINSHMPSEGAVEYVPGVLAKISKLIEKDEKKKTKEKIEKQALNNKEVTDGTQAKPGRK
jgi:hypothetical protein